MYPQSDWEYQMREEAWERSEAARQRREEHNTLWQDYEDNWVEMTEFRIPAKSAARLQMELDFSEEVA